MRKISSGGRPTPSVEWLDNHGKVVKDSRKFKIENTGMNTVFTINKIDSEDVGDYTLRIKNRCGQDSLPIGIQVTDRPGAPGKPSVQDQNVDSVKLMWSAPTQDGGSPVRSYLVEMSSGNNKNWTRAEVTKQPMTSLFNLVPGETYKFRVKAENAFGQSEPSEESEPVFVKDLSRTVEEPKKTKAVVEQESINYDKLDSKVEPSEYKTVDIHNLPNDLQAKYIICEELGRGAYGTVYRAIEKATGKTWAAKMVQVRPGVKKENVMHEISIMNQLHHDKLLNLHEAFDLGNEMCLIEEFVSGGELFEKIMEDESLMSEEEVRDYMHQILLGVQHMHKNSIVHLDLKPENILLKNKNSTDLKIIDFGLARKLDPKKSVKLLFGTPEFCAPEVVNYQPVGLSTDMWTIGVISYVLLSGLSPFLGDNDEDTLANVSAADWDFDDPSWDDVSDLAKDFICRLMVKDKRRRMTVQDALRHPWITGPLLSAFNDLSEYVKKTQPAPDRNAVPSRQKRNFLSLKRWSDDLLPIGRMAKRGAIFRRLTMDGVFERKIEFDTECAPSIRKKLEDIVANVGDLIATLSCDLAGSPVPKIVWYKDQKEINVPSNKYEARYSDGLTELFVKNIETTDAGNYSCRATNDLGSITTQAALKVDGKDATTKKKPKADTSPAAIAKKKTTKAKTAVEESPVADSPPDFHHKLTDCTVKIGDTKILVVTNTTLPEPVVDWYHDGIPVTETGTKYLKKHDKGRYELEILSVDVYDEGEWKAVGKNSFGVCDSKCQLKVEIPSDMSAPSFDHPLSDVRCEEKDMLKLEVKLAANPAPEISWFRDDSEIVHGDRHRLLFDDDSGNYSLTIMNAYKEDSGEYKCVAKNKVGKAKTVCCVRIEELEQKKSKKLDASKAPRFLMHLANPREVPEGAEMVLVAAVTGAPVPSVTWLKNDKTIDMDGKDVRFENGVCTFTIFAVRQDDAGTYVCEASNIHGTTRSTSLVEIKPPVDNLVKPKFVESLLNSSTMEGDEIVLECTVTAKPNPTITWYKDGLKLIIENRMLHYTDRKGVARLNIMNAQIDDAGEYTCEAVNAAGKDFTHCAVKVVDMGLAKSRLTPSRGSRSRSGSPSLRSMEERAPVITRPLSDATVVEGNRELLEVEVSGCPVPMIEWYHDGKLVAESRTLRTYFDGRVAFLKIYQAQKDHQGQYVCKVFNKLGSVECRATLAVKGTDESEHVPKMPSFVKKLQDIVVNKVGDSATLTCQFHGEPAPTVCWLHNGRAVHDENIRSRIFDDNTAVLEIANVTEELCGTYTVVATNNFGDAHSSAEVSLAQKATQKVAACLPYFIVEPKPKIVVEQGSTLCINTDIKGTPDPEIVWMKDNCPLNATDRVQFKQDGISYQLMISNVAPDDEGTYTVSAENPKGKVRQNTDVVVTLKRGDEPKTSVKIVKKDEAPGDVQQATLNNATSTTVTVTWSPPSEGGSDIESYEVDIKTPDSSEWQAVKTNKKTEIVLKELKANTEYVLRIKAVNKAGKSNGVSVPIKTLPLGEKPVFNTSPPISHVRVSSEEGTSLTLAFFGIPQPAVKWYKDGKELVESENVTIAIGESSTSVIITEPVAGRDDGLYSCHLENSEGHAYNETTVTVKDNEKLSTTGSDIAEKVPRGTPVVQKQLNNEAATAGQQFILVCRITSNPKGTVCWYFNDERIESKGRYEISEGDNGNQKLVCHASNENDSGVYRCVVTNCNGVAQTESKVAVTDIKSQVAPQVVPDKDSITVIANSEIVLKCKVAGNPEPQIVWTKDGEPISTNRRTKLTFVDGGCQLVISKLNGDDSGVYLCSASNVVGVHSAHIELTVGETTGVDRHLVIAEPTDEKKVSQKPRFIRAPASTMEVMEGGQFKLIAKAVGDPKPNVTWKKDGRPILRTNRLYKHFVTGDGESHLIVECVVSKTSGIFSCVAENSFGEEEVETQVFVQRGKPVVSSVEAPTFVQPLSDQGIVDGHPVSLVCKVRGVPEPELKWYYIDDNGQTTNLTADGRGWVECRGGETAELKAERIIKSQQGTYQCIATNSKGEASSQCYLLVGGLADEPAGPPRFLKCLRDIWNPLGETITFEVEVAGCPLPELTWYHNDRKVKEGKNIEIRYVSDSNCQLIVTNPSLADMGSYCVEASNVHGVVRTTGFANVGQPRHLEPPQFKEMVTKQALVVQPKVAFDAKVKKSASTVRMEMKKKGAAPVFVHGLEDMDLKAGDSAAVAGKLGRRHAHHKRSTQEMDDAQGLAKAIMAAALEEDGGRKSTEENPAIVEIRTAIQSRNRRICRPKFMIKPKPKKILEEYKSLRLKTAISSNPMPTVHWDKDGIILETGNKYSIYNDGDFYYLEVHHVSPIDKGFYNCTAANSEGIITCSSEVDVVRGEASSVHLAKRKSKKEAKAPTFIEVLPGKLKATMGEPVSVECSVSGYPCPWIQWFRNGTPLLPQADKCLLSFDGECATLRLFNVSPSDDAVYCCEARNEHGEAKSQMNFSVEGTNGDATANGVPPQFATEKIRSIIKATDGDRVVLAAELTQGSEPMQIRWLRNKMTITNSLSFQYMREGQTVKLQIADAFPEDAGEYVVEAKNSFGVAKCVMRLDVQSNEGHSVAEEAPRILDAQTPVRVACGLAAELRAHVLGHPDPVIAWEKGTVSCHAGEKYTMSNEGSVFRLRVNDTVHADCGKYTLTAVNVAGQTSSVIELIVHEQTSPSSSIARFTHSPVSVQARLGQRAELRARFSGVPAPVCRWFKGDRELEDGVGGLLISETSDSSTLSIVFLENEHVGEYLCTVRNSLGEDLATAMILLEAVMSLYYYVFTSALVHTIVCWSAVRLYVV